MEQLSTDKKNLFLVNRSELIGRIDPPYYKDKPDFTNCIKLSKIAKIKGGKRIPVGKTYSNTRTNKLYLRVADMQNEFFRFENFNCISDDLFNFLERYEVFENELIISIAGTVGKIRLLKNIPDNTRIILTENCVKIHLKEEILPDYLKLVLETKFVQHQINYSYIQTTIPKLGIDKILDLKLPIFPEKDIQKKLVEQINNAYKNKIAKENEAKELLSSINDYLLNELEIEIPELDYSLKNRIFSSSFKEITGKRFDAFAIFNKDFRIEGGKYENKKLKQLAHLIKGQSITSDKVKAGEYPVIAGGQSSPYSHNEYNHEGNIITVSASGAYSGFVWYHDYPIFASDCTVVFSKDEASISTVYISEIMKCKQKEIYNLQQGAGQPHVYASDFGEINIPVPKPEKQNEIVDHIKAIRNKAAQLEKEATEILEQTKLEIERQILGE